MANAGGRRGKAGAQPGATVGDTKKARRKVGIAPGLDGQVRLVGLDGPAPLTPLTRRGLDTLLSPADNTSGDVGPSGTSASPSTAPQLTITSAPDRLADVSRIDAFLTAEARQPTLARSPEMSGALDQLQRVVDAFKRGDATDAALQRAMSTLRLIETTGRPTVPLDEALRPKPTSTLTPKSFGLVLDGQKVTGFSFGQMQDLNTARGRGPNFPAGAALGYVLADGTFDGTTQQLVALLDDTEKALMGVPVANDKAVQLAKMSAEDRAAQDELRWFFADAGITATMRGGSAPQCRALLNWLKRNPKYLTNLKAKGVAGFVFGSAEAAGPGEYKKPFVHMADLPDKPPDQFVRLTVHETGHAGFQRALIGELSMGADIEAYVNAAMEHLDVFNAFEHSTSPDQQAALKARLDELEKTLATGAAAWDQFSPDAKRFYRAWMELRREKGRYLIGVDQGRNTKKSDMNQADRQSYQAATFIELCAEGFMHLAMGDLDPFVAVIQSRDDIPDEVRKAWSVVQHILHQYGDPLLGRS